MEYSEPIKNYSAKSERRDFLLYDVLEKDKTCYNHGTKFCATLLFTEKISRENQSVFIDQ